MKYKLVHIVASAEYFTPLVQTQVFEQAYLQHTWAAADAPAGVEVWVPVSLQQFFSSKFRSYKARLQQRFPGLPIRLIPGIDRLEHFPRKMLLLLRRSLMGGRAVIFHFRGETQMAEFAFLKQLFRNDRFVADIRGIWPAEYLLQLGYEVWTEQELMTHAAGREKVQELVLPLQHADGITAVTPRLLEWVRSLAPQGTSGWVVPCSARVSGQLPDGYFEEKASIRQELGIPADALVLGYLGGAAPYQHLEDMVLPLMQAILNEEPRGHLLIITHEQQKIRAMLNQLQIGSERVCMVSLQQQDVQHYLKAMDLGFLVRRESLVNQMALPVKLGEYLAAGVPVCVEGNIAGAGTMLQQHGAGVQVHMATEGTSASAGRCLSYLRQTTETTRASQAHQVACETFSWERNAGVHRANYSRLLQQTKQ